MSRLRICFAGTPAFAAAHLSCLIAHDYQPVAVYTQPDRPAGRGRKLRASPVKELAVQAHIPVCQPDSFASAAAWQALSELAPDLLVVVAYGLILPPAVLAIPRYGGINVHASLLPRWRGAAPIERAILAGDPTTGISIMQMDAGLDSGPLLHTESIAIAAGDDRMSLTDKLCEVGQRALLFTLENLDRLRADPVPQQHDAATYADKFTSADCLIDWGREAVRIAAQIRAGAGRFPAFSFLGTRRIRILQGRPCGDSQGNEPAGTIIDTDKDHCVVQCHHSALAITRVQLSGKQPMAVRELLHSPTQPLQPGARFTNTVN